MQYNPLEMVNFHALAIQDIKNKALEEAANPPAIYSATTGQQLACKACQIVNYIVNENTNFYECIPAQLHYERPVHGLPVKCQGCGFAGGGILETFKINDAN